MVYSLFRQNFYFAFGIVIGLSLEVVFIPYLEKGCFLPSTLVKTLPKDELNLDDYEPRINLAAKPAKAQRSPQKLLRPRYFSTELGIKEKLFVAVLTTQETINTRAVAINKTVSHLVDKLMFFIDVPGPQKLNVSYLNLPGIVGFVDTRLILKLFHILKYIKDNYIENYDFFFVIKDGSYLKARKLYDIVQIISISQDVYASAVSPDTLFCSLDAGILFSNSVFQKMLKNIDWCVKNAFSSSDDDNFGRCVLHSTTIPCQSLVQGNYFTSFKLEDEAQLENNMNNLIANAKFEDALTVYPIRNTRTFYKLHFHFSKAELSVTELEIASLRRSISNMSIHHPEGYRQVSWPIGNQPGNKPDTRFDVLRWNYFTEHHIYLKDDFSNIRQLNTAEKVDIQNVLNGSIEMVESKNEGLLQYHSLVNGYRRFDPSRGMDYKLDLAFRDIRNRKLVLKRIEVCKPLGKVEILPVPYVTENRRVSILLPVRMHEKQNVRAFMKQYRTVCLEKKDKTFLMLVLLYEHNAPGKGTKDDVFKDIKQEATQLSRTFQKEDSKIAWVSVKLLSPGVLSVRDALLDFAVVDLALKKFSPDSLILLARPSMEIKMDYLNRVRMNTISEWQVFSPIPFSEYNPSIVYNADNPRLLNLEIDRRYGHFDTYNTQHISFYVKDYFTARKRMESVIPIMNTDGDIRHITYLNTTSQNDNVTSLVLDPIYNMFVRFSDVHILRAVEPALRLHYQEYNCQQYSSIVDSITGSLYKQCIDKRNYNLGSRSQLAKLILDYKSTKQNFL